jgi:hypothetical protein
MPTAWLPCPGKINARLMRVLVGWCGKTGGLVAPGRREVKPWRAAGSQ